MDAVRVFDFQSPILSSSIVLSQPGVGGAIGFKLYPAALFCCKLFETIHVAQCSDSGDVSALWRAIRLPSKLPPIPPTMPLLSQLLQTPIKGSIILELGAGICGLPSQLLARMGANAIATVRLCFGLDVLRLSQSGMYFYLNYE